MWINPLAYPLCIHYPLTNHMAGGEVTRSSATISQCSFMFKWRCCYLIMAPGHKSSDAGNLDMPKRSHKGLSWSEKGESLRYFARERSQIPITFFLQYVYIVIVLSLCVDLLQCLIYKWNFIIGMCAWEKTYKGFDIIFGFSMHWEVLESRVSPWIRGYL